MAPCMAAELQLVFAQEDCLKSWGIRERVLFVAIIPATFIAFVLAAYFLFLRYADAEKELLERSQSLIRMLTPAAEYGVFSGNREELNNLVNGLAKTPDIKSVAIHGQEGVRLAFAGKSELSIDPQRLPDGWTGRNEAGSVQAFHAKIWRPVLPISDPLTWPGSMPADNESIGSITIEFARTAIIQRKREMMGVTLVATVLTLALGALFALRLSRDVSAPILSLQRVVESIRRGRLESRVLPHPAKTLQGLEDGINEMAAAMQAGRDQLQNRIAIATAELKEKKEEAERASQAKSRFLAATSHDLRQPLHALTLFSADLIEKADEPELIQLAGQISAAVDSLGELLDGLLDLSRIDLGATQPEIVPVELGPLLGRIVAAHAASARAKGLDLRQHPTSAWVLSDSILLYRMISNLVSNAVRYTDRGRILIGTRRCGARVRIEVWDTGIGIPEEHHPLVFQEFFQAGNPERDRNKGLGIGLSVVERLSKLLSHPIHLRSIPRKGSVFGITLPRCPAVHPGPDRPEPVFGAFDAAVLIVECDDTMERWLCDQLGAWGCRVTALRQRTEIEPETCPPFDLVFCGGSDCAQIASMIGSHSMKGHPATLIAIGQCSTGAGERPGVRVLHLATPVKPAKLRALMQHLLQEEQDLYPGIPSAA